VEVNKFRMGDSLLRVRLDGKWLDDPFVASMRKQMVRLAENRSAVSSSSAAVVQPATAPVKAAGSAPAPAAAAQPPPWWGVPPMQPYYPYFPPQQTAYSQPPPGYGLPPAAPAPVAPTAPVAKTQAEVTPPAPLKPPKPPKTPKVKKVTIPNPQAIPAVGDTYTDPRDNSVIDLNQFDVVVNNAFTGPAASKLSGQQLGEWGKTNVDSAGKRKCYSFHASGFCKRAKGSPCTFSHNV
jgi:hypothetical protein